VQKTFTVWTRDRQVLSSRVSQEELYRLRGLTENGRSPFLDREGRPEVGPQLVIPHRRLRGVWIIAAGVSEDVIRAELRRKISKTVPMAEANTTVSKVHFSNEKGAGAFWQLNEGTCFHYRTTWESMQEHWQRIGERSEATA
jgi:hypothetical protein